MTNIYHIFNNDIQTIIQLLQIKKLFSFTIICSFATLLPGQVVERLPGEINTDKYDEVAPILSPDGKTLYFSRLGYPEMVETLIHNGEDLSQTLSRSEWKKRIGEIYSKLAGHRVSFPLLSVYNQDIWIAKLDDQSVTSVELPRYPLNNALPNTVLSYWDQQDELILLNQFFTDGSMNEGLSRIEAEIPDHLPQPLHIYDFYTLGSDVQASISPSGDILILALEREDSHGDMDLYVSFRSGKEIWSEPKNLGTDLNTSFRESTPFLSRNGQFLFFASNRPGGKGGMDIYVTKRKDDWQSWEKPEPLASPINSISDDSHPFFHTEKSQLYFTSMREGSSDIYRLTYQVTDEKAQSISQSLLLELKIIEAGSGVPIQANTQFVINESNVMASISDSLKTKPGIILKSPEKVKIQVEKDGYQKVNYMFDPKPYMEDGEEKVELTINLIKLEDQNIYADETATSHPYKVPDYKKDLLNTDETMLESYIMQDILFHRNSAKIKPSSFPALKRLVDKLSINSDLTVIIEGHTDNGLENNEISSDPVKRKKHLLSLSKDRAEAVKAYIVEQNIDPTRIRTVGYGGQFPLNDNSNKVERRLNRRVEIILVD